ncbi:hypothetical protein EVAR_44686_1 [Eumeta japonica]|uniref:Uncharacterized protein n=1 Tax=Eumeta variegata TaxID=151549 RepID=A0A4C1XFW0_EUMVA|nr:hypothetical protein EVAR_44686_1 [Eumeta japonica]
MVIADKTTAFGAAATFTFGRRQGARRGRRGERRIESACGTTPALRRADRCARVACRILRRQPPRRPTCAFDSPFAKLRGLLVCAVDQWSTGSVLKCFCKSVTTEISLNDITLGRVADNNTLSSRSRRNNRRRASAVRAV